MGSFENFENNDALKLEKVIHETEKKIKEVFYEPDVSIEKGEENDRYSVLRDELKDKQKGGVDIHLANIDIDKISNKLLDIYEEYKKRKIYFEKDLAEFRKTIAVDSDDFNFAAMILNWHMDRVYEEKHKSDKN